MQFFMPKLNCNTLIIRCFMLSLKLMPIFKLNA
nr:MAG TPA: hypothetical protein [Caudoviricetes sp.]